MKLGFKLSIVLIVGIGPILIAQDVQSLYKQSTAAYTDQRYDEAMVLSEKAFQLAGADPKLQAYAVQILTASSLQINKPEQGLQYIAREIELFSKVEPSGKNYAEALVKRSNLLLMQGKNAEAVSSFAEALPALERAYGSKNYQYYQALFQQAQAMAMAGMLEQARKNFEICLNVFPTLDDAGEDYLYALFYSSDVYLKLNEKPLAGQNLKQFVLLLEKNGLTGWPEYTRAKEILATLPSNPSNSSSAETQDLITSLQKAISLENRSFNEALAQYEVCGKLITEKNMENGPAYSYYINYAKFLCRNNDDEKANASNLKAKALAQKLFPAGSQEHGYACVVDGMLRVKENRPEEALTSFRQALTYFNKAAPEIRYKQIPEIAGQMLAVSYDEAIGLVESALRNADFIASPFQVQQSLVRFYSRTCIENRRAAQLVTSLDALALRAASPELKQISYLYAGIGYGSLGNFEKAIAQLNAAISAGPQGDRLAEIYYERARQQQQLGHFKESEEDYKKSVSLLAQSDEQLAGQVYNSFATYYIELGNYRAAEKLFNDLLKAQSLSPAFYNTVRQNLAVIYQQTSRLARAKSILIEVLKSDEQHQGRLSGAYSISLQNLALVYQKLNQPDSALLLMTDALAIDRKLYGENNLAFATKLANLGALYQDLHNFSKAREIFEQALAIRRKLLSTNHPDYAYNVYNLAYLFYRTQHPQDALPLFRQTASYYLRQVREVFPSLSDYERTVFYNKVQPVIRAYESFMTENLFLDPGMVAELLNFRLETKALLLNSAMKARATILSSGNARLINQFNTWQHTKEQLAFLYTLSLNEQKKHIRLMEEYEASANDLEKSLSLQSAGFAGAFDRTRTDWKKIQAILKPDEAAVEILRIALPKKDSVVYTAIVLKPNGDPELIQLPYDNSESRNYNRYSKSIHFKQQDDQSYDVYWKKINEALGTTVTTVYVSPDGIYNKINCLTLYDPAAKQYVVERLNIQLLTNLKELLNKQTEAQQPAKVASLIGSPDFRLNATRKPQELQGHSREAETFFEVLQDGGLSELPGTAQEVLKIEEILRAKGWNVNAYMREKATEEVVKSLRPELLHIATHGFFVAVNQEGDAHSNDASLSNIKNNTMLRSGILLAGAEKNLIDKIEGRQNDMAEDGVLTALEVMNLTLDKTSLVVLSACETAAGDVRNGEGVYGLQRAFLLAGAKSLIMSLWKVDDEATQQLMTHFYTFWMNGDSKALAFRKAQLELKSKFNNPYYWGAFVLVGSQ